jgi:mRNA interferase YafQ
MMKLQTTNAFRKDYKRCKKRGLDMKLLQEVIKTLLAEKTLAEKHHDHALVGEYIGFRECHIQPDWLLIYKADKESLILIASRTGKHNDIFDE